MAAAINWDGSRNTKDYLANLREKIETVQALTSSPPGRWTELPAAPDQQAVAAKTQPVIVVWDRNETFFRNWTAEFKNGDGIDHGRRIAVSIGGTYTIVGDTSVEPVGEKSPASVWGDIRLRTSAFSSPVYSS